MIIPVLAEGAPKSPVVLIKNANSRSVFKQKCFVSGCNRSGPFLRKEGSNCKCALFGGLGRTLWAITTCKAEVRLRREILQGSFLQASLHPSRPPCPALSLLWDSFPPLSLLVVKVHPATELLSRHREAEREGEDLWRTHA